MFSPWEILSSPKKILKLRLLFPKENIGKAVLANLETKDKQKKGPVGVPVTTKQNSGISALWNIAMEIFYCTYILCSFLFEQAVKTYLSIQ